MTRHEAEKLIMEKLIEVKQIATEYMEMPIEYLDVTIIGNHISISNRCYTDDKARPIDYTVWLDESGNIIDEVRHV